MRSRLNVAVSKKTVGIGEKFFCDQVCRGEHGNGDKIVDCFGFFELNSPLNSVRPPKLSR